MACLNGVVKSNSSLSHASFVQTQPCGVSLFTIQV